MPFSLLPFHADDFLKAFESLLWLSFKQTCRCQELRLGDETRRLGITGHAAMLSEAVTGAYVRLP